MTLLTCRATTRSWRIDDAPLGDVEKLREINPMDAVNTALLSVSGMPKRYRPRVEDLMVRCLNTEPELVEPEDVMAAAMTAEWFTHWMKDAPGMPTIRCRQVITGTTSELELLESELRFLLHDTDAEVSLNLLS